MNATTRAASISAVSALVLAAVWFLWPLTLGGGTTYVTTHGISMEPGFSTGDLAVLRSAGSYSVGDVVAYRAESLNTVVMHRIVAVEDDRFVLQGDNNGWLDEDRPDEGEVLGSLLVRIPQGGKALDALTSPAVLALVGVAAMLVLGSTRLPRGRHRRRSPGRSAPSFSMPTRVLARQVALGSAAVVALAAVACGVLLVLPSTQTGTRAVEVTQRGEYAYTGEAAAGTTYPTGVITTGDTVWTRLARGLTVSFTNTVTGPGVTGVSGAMHLDVVVSAPDGWSAVLDSGDVVELRDGAATASVGVDADAAAALLARHYAEIGGSGGSGTVTVTPVSETRGTLDGRPFTADPPSGLAFSLDAAALKPAGDPRTVFAPTSATAVQIEEVVPRTFEALSLSVSSSLAQQVAGVVLLLSLVTLGIGAWIGRTSRGDVAGQFLVRHADRILPVAAFTPGPAVVDVSDVESLHRVAERFDTVVLHHVGPDGDVFAVRDLDMTYRFVIPGTPGGRTGKPPVPVHEKTEVPGQQPSPAPNALRTRFA
jgi:signal peptidase I